MIVLDASVLIAFLRETDQHHDPAREVLAAHAESQVHPLNLAEALVQPVRAGRDDEAIRIWAAAGVVESREDAGGARALARVRAETALRLPDCCPLVLAESRRSPLATFDTRLARVARDRGIEVLSAED